MNTQKTLLTILALMQGITLLMVFQLSRNLTSASTAGQNGDIRHSDTITQLPDWFTDPELLNGRQLSDLLSNPLILSREVPSGLGYPNTEYYALTRLGEITLTIKDGTISCFLPIDWSKVTVKTVNHESEQAGTGQPATRPESKSEGSDKPQPDSEGRSR